MYLVDNLKLTPQSMFEKAVALGELQEMHQQVYIMLATLFVSICAQYCIYFRLQKLTTYQVLAVTSYFRPIQTSGNMLYLKQQYFAHF